MRKGLHTTEMNSPCVQKTAQSFMGLHVSMASRHGDSWRLKGPLVLPCFTPKNGTLRAVDFFLEPDMNGPRIWSLLLHESIKPEPVEQTSQHGRFEPAGSLEDPPAMRGSKDWLH